MYAAENSIGHIVIRIKARLQSLNYFVGFPPVNFRYQNYRKTFFRTNMIFVVFAESAMTDMVQLL